MYGSCCQSFGGCGIGTSMCSLGDGGIFSCSRQVSVNRSRILGSLFGVSFPSSVAPIRFVQLNLSSRGKGRMISAFC